ncbi:hypothetical protein vBRpoSV10_12 [Ruegeria phage vB_RpoS-V10]|nr:hypothetical protein DSS3P8_013 [Roseobacter phage DSS3P8]AWY09134.1 hypothetical protein vBRpoSV10_12 [Ruegeria phage vB_RpoS-V10]
MPYSVDTLSYFVIDGDETNAGARAFLRDTHMVVIDGAEVGTAGLRQFLKDSRFRIISGGPSKQAYESILYTSMFAITGRGSIGECSLAQHAVFAIEGNSPAGGPLPVRSTSFFTIEDVPQEAAP